MKIKSFAIILAIGALASLSACSDDDKGIKVPDTFRDALMAQFPQAKNVEWENKAGYRVADFKVGNVDTEAWYTTDADWVMTVRELGKNQSALPVPVAGALSASEYASWRIDDIDYYERVAESFYVIDIEKAGLTDTELYYTPDGILLKAVPDTDAEILPTTPI
ncbi:MAG: PepSY-like domain-containing protein [Bacteroidales bacterium]|nr:PepSY-like domain-containing protein [Bacteroidales bacterium]